MLSMMVVVIDLHLVYLCLQFGVAWLMLIDGNVYQSKTGGSKIQGWYYVPGIIGTLALLMYINFFVC